MPKTKKPIIKEMQLDAGPFYGYRLRYLREFHNMSQQELGKRIGMHYLALRRAELSEYIPVQEKIDKICKVFGIPESFFRDAEVRFAFRFHKIVIIGTSVKCTPFRPKKRQPK